MTANDKNPSNYEQKQPDLSQVDSSLTSSSQDVNDEKEAKSAEFVDSEGNFDACPSNSEQNSSSSASNGKKDDPVDEIDPFEALISRDLKNFSRLYPNVPLSALTSDECLILYAKGRESEPFTEIYKNFRDLCDKIEQKALNKASLALATATPGALGSSGAPNDGFFTKEQVLRMSSEEISRNYDKIRKSQEKW